MGKDQMTKSAAGEIQSSQAKNGRDMSSGGFAARAQSAAARNEAAAGQQNTGPGHKTGGSSGGAGGKK
ncbi:uncharacterized protein GGS25DRAFT_525347 [Hypoxylon fragiforme]|uniref:uncharacterized protein n=1 Tax=Hypoxylon fragiforme TaxID=63214 RepID=UPI0020C5D0F1|nr:uncharacterized protein GGS25DRAFT_525347 [Hypoxylon fragiforme]KAI2604068.1 hypothetical protein GGS25DRAFT_525347 [Hypoxylon fragiforme]